MLNGNELRNGLGAFEQVVCGGLACVKRPSAIEAMILLLFLNVRHCCIPNVGPIEFISAHSPAILFQALERFNNPIYTIPASNILSNWNVAQNFLDPAILFNLPDADPDEEHLRSDKRDLFLLE